MSFSLSSQINNLQRKSLIWAPHNGRVDDFLRSHQLNDDMFAHLTENFNVYVGPQNRENRINHDSGEEKIL